MKRILLGALLLFMASNLSAQELKQDCPGGQVYKSVKTKPSYQGSMDDLIQNITKGIDANFLEKGQVVFALVVNCEGVVIANKKVRGTLTEAQEEQLNNNLKSIKWIPGKNEVPVPTMFSLVLKRDNGVYNLTMEM